MAKSGLNLLSNKFSYKNKHYVRFSEGLIFAYMDVVILFSITNQRTNVSIICT